MSAKNADSYAKHLLACMVRYNRLAAACKVQGKIRMEICNQEEILTAMIPMELHKRLQLEDIRRMAEQAEEDVFYAKKRGECILCISTYADDEPWERSCQSRILRSESL